jgi:hypothetical protein
MWGALSDEGLDLVYSCKWPGIVFFLIILVRVTLQLTPSPFLLRWNGTESTITEDTYWPTVPALDDEGNGEISGMLGRGNRCTLRKPAPVPLYLPQIPHDLSRAQTGLGNYFPTTMSWVHPRRGHVGFWGQSGNVVGSVPVFQFPLPILISKTGSHSFIILSWMLHNLDMTVIKRNLIRRNDVHVYSYTAQKTSQKNYPHDVPSPFF